MKSFKKRWNITSNSQAIVIIIVFALTGSTSAWIAKPILALFGITKDSISLYFFYPLYLIIIFPFYQILLISFGYLLGQFKFFWAFEKKMLENLKLGWLIKYLEHKKRNY